MTKFIFKFDSKFAVYTDRKLIISVCHCHITSYLNICGRLQNDMIRWTSVLYNRLKKNGGGLHWKKLFYNILKMYCLYCCVDKKHKIRYMVLIFFIYTCNLMKSWIGVQYTLLQLHPRCIHSKNIQVTTRLGLTVSVIVFWKRICEFSAILVIMSV